MPDYQAPLFLTELLRAKSPSGAEAQAQAVYDRFVKPHAAAYTNDALGNRLATLNPKGGPTLMLAGHMDELGLIITYVNKDGYLYFDTIGGHDRSIISGRRVIIQSARGTVKGVTGKRARRGRITAARGCRPAWSHADRFFSSGTYARKVAVQAPHLHSCSTRQSHARRKPETRTG